MKIVSSNYRSRPIAPRIPFLRRLLGEKAIVPHQGRWLARDESEGPRKAVELDSLIAVGVKFSESPAHEQGFDCWVVAFCQEATATEQLPDKDDAGVKLRFDRSEAIFYGPGDSVVQECERLHLYPDGDIYAVLASVPAAASAVAAA